MSHSLAFKHSLPSVGTQYPSDCCNYEQTIAGGLRPKGYVMKEKNELHLKALRPRTFDPLTM